MCRAFQVPPATASITLTAYQIHYVFISETAISIEKRYFQCSEKFVSAVVR